jgi:hypothetical protein
MQAGGKLRAHLSSTAPSGAPALEDSLPAHSSNAHSSGSSAAARATAAFARAQHAAYHWSRTGT